MLEVCKNRKEDCLYSTLTPAEAINKDQHKVKNHVINLVNLGLWLWWIFFVQNSWLTNGVNALIPAGTIAKDSHYFKSPALRNQGLNLRRVWFQTLLAEVVQ